MTNDEMATLLRPECSGLRRVKMTNWRIATMTKFLLPLVTLLCIQHSRAQGIIFEHSTWQQALAQARAERKLVFVDAYTTWCGPCKTMAAKTFTDSAVAAQYNAQFVNLKMDMEVGEGPLLAQRYAVQYFPSLLFVNADGAVAHKAVGYHSPAEFIALGRLAADTAANLLALNTRYDLGDRSPDLLYALTALRSAAYDPSVGQLATEYFDTQTDLGTPENMDAVLRYTTDPYSTSFKYLMQHRPAFEAKFGAEQVAQKVDAVFEEYMRSRPTLQLGEVQRLYGTCYPEQGERLASNYRIAYYQQRDDMDNFARSALDHYERFPTDDADELNEIASLFAQNLSDPALLQQAILWAKRAVGLQENCLNQATLATLYFKLGKKKSAAKAAHRAIELAQAAGEDDAPMRELLRTMNEKR